MDEKGEVDAGEVERGEDVPKLFIRNPSVWCIFGWWRRGQYEESVLKIPNGLLMRSGAGEVLGEVVG